jgi:hypothetical protein
MYEEDISSGLMLLRANVFRANVHRARANVTAGKYLRENVFRANVIEPFYVEEYF